MNITVSDNCALVDSRSKVAEEGSDVLSPLVIALDDVLHLQRTRWRKLKGGACNGRSWCSIKMVQESLTPNYCKTTSAFCYNYCTFNSRLWHTHILNMRLGAVLSPPRCVSFCLVFFLRNSQYEPLVIDVIPSSMDRFPRFSRLRKTNIYKKETFNCYFLFFLVLKPLAEVCARYCYAVYRTH